MPTLNSIDESARKALSQNVRCLITGRMTNEDFDDLYYEHYDPSSDRGVREIASFCYSLYSSDVWPYRLRGRYAVDQETRATAARCVLFLRFGKKYEWPPMPDDAGLRVLAGWAMFFGIPAGIALQFFWILIANYGWDGVGGFYAFFGTLLLIGSLYLSFCWPQSLKAEWKSFREAGDWELWPFLRQADFDCARESRHLLGKG